MSLPVVTEERDRRARTPLRLDGGAACHRAKWYSTAPGVGMHFIVNNAVGGDWPGNPNSSTWATADGARYLKVSSITYTPYYP
ncbi:hypothetical protein [Streptomyces sp. NPDC005046]